MITRLALVLPLIACFFSIPLFAQDKIDNNVLIYSPTHAPITYTREKKGTIKVGITSFAPILRVTVDGYRRRLVLNSQAEFEIPYNVSETKPTIYKVRVFTDAGVSEKVFEFHYGDKPKPPPPPFMFITLLGITSTDNVDNASVDETKTSASKTTLTLVPHYRFFWGRENNSVGVKGIVLREKFSEEEYQNKEISYTQLAFEYHKNETFYGDLFFTLGFNQIALNNKNVLRGENETGDEQFFNFGSTFKFGATTKLKMQLEYKIKDSKLAESIPDDNLDAVEQSLKTQLNFQAFGMKGKLKTKISINDALIEFHDSTTVNLSLGLDYKYKNWKPAWSYAIKEKNKEVVDTRFTGTGVKDQKTLGTMILKVGYKIAAKSLITFQYKSKNQSSNVLDANYEVNETSLVLTQIF